jgi:hypothetical protein
MRAVGSIVILSLMLSGCSTIRDSRVNPLNWFKNDEPAARKSLIPEENRILKRNVAPYAGTPVYFVTAAAMEPTLDGKLLRITAQTDRMGAAEVRIEDMADQGDGIVRVVIKAVVPAGAPVGTEANRTITAARFFSAQDLIGLKAIDVNSANNVIRLRP